MATINLSDLEGAIDRAGKATWPTELLREGLPTRGLLQVSHEALEGYPASAPPRELVAFCIGQD